LVGTTFDVHFLIFYVRKINRSSQNFGENPQRGADMAARDGKNDGRIIDDVTSLYGWFFNTIHAFGHFAIPEIGDLPKNTLALNNAAITHD
jgi:hypothetical protein